MSTENSQALGDRSNWWGDEDGTDQGDEPAGHAETQGTDPAEYLAFQYLSELADPICGRTLAKSGREQPLSEPCMYLPKQRETEHGYQEYRQHRHRRRVNEETGWINWGESTSTDVPEVDEETYLQAVNNYLAESGVSVTNVEDWLTLANRLWSDPTMNSKESLIQFITHKRQFDRDRQDPGQTATIPI